MAEEQKELMVNDAMKERSETEISLTETAEKKKTKKKKYSPLLRIFAVFVLIGVLGVIMQDILVPTVLKKIYELYAEINSVVTGKYVGGIMLGVDDFLNKSVKILQRIIEITVVIFVWKCFEKKPLSEMGLTKNKGMIKEFTAGLLLGAAAGILPNIFRLYMESAELVIPTPIFDIRILYYMVCCILIGTAEEMFSRGYVMNVLKKKYNIYLTVIISAVIFAALHLSSEGNNTSWAFIQRTISGVLYAYMYIKSGNLYMAMGYHMVWDFCIFSVWGAESFGREASLYRIRYLQPGVIDGKFLTIAVLIMCFLFVKFYYRKSEYKFMKE